jgi:hypothetical protein
VFAKNLADLLGGRLLAVAVGMSWLFSALSSPFPASVSSIYESQSKAVMCAAFI